MNKDILIVVTVVVTGVVAILGYSHQSSLAQSFQSNNDAIDTLTIALLKDRALGSFDGKGFYFTTALKDMDADFTIGMSNELKNRLLVETKQQLYDLGINKEKVVITPTSALEGNQTCR